MVTIPFALSASVSGNTRVTYFLDGNQPSWVYVDSTTGLVTADTSQATIGSTYVFGVLAAPSPSTWTHSQHQQQVSISVVGCTPESITDKCIDWLEYNAEKWDECQFGYSVSDNNTCSDARLSTEAEAAVLSSQVLSGSSISIASIIALVTMSSPVTMWLIANQVQLVSLLLLSGAFLPPSVKEIMLGTQLTSSSFSAIPVLEIPIINVPVKSFEIEQDNVNLELMGLNSGSSLVSNYLFFLSIAAIVVLHLFTLLIPKWTQPENEGRGSKWLRKFRDFIDNFLGFAIYIRLYIESFQYMLLSSICEINAMCTDSLEKIISLGFAFVVLAICMLGTLLVFLLIWKNSFKSLERFRETFIGLKDAELAKTYILMSMFLRKVIYIGIMISLVSMISTIYLWIGIIVIEIFITGYLVFVRPYERLQDNLIELANQFIFIVLVCFLMFLNKPEHWNPTWEVVVMWVIVSNNLIMTSILVCKLLPFNFIGFAIKLVISKIVKKSNKNKVAVSKDWIRNNQVSFKTW